MVKNFQILMYGLIICGALAGDLAATTPQIKADVHSESQIAGGRLEGTLSIYHDGDQQVDTSQVLMDGKPLKVERLFSTQLTPQELQDYPDFTDKSLLTVLRFTLEGKTQGLYMLPAISVPVGGVRVSTVPSSFDIQATTAVVDLKIEPITDPEGPYYPSERAQFGYRIFYDQSVALTSEVLPLLSPAGFEKIGQPEVKDSATSAMSTQIITQEVRAQQPGSYAVPESVIEGYHYTPDAQGKPIPSGALLRAITAAQTIEIRPFPEEGRPASFNGIVGAVNLDVRLLSEPVVLVGDELKLSLSLTAEELEGLSLPDLACQPEFSGFFRFSDFPPAESTGNKVKEFTVTLKPMSTLVTTIPPIEISYFDPMTQTYQTVHSLAIPITVQEAPVKTQEIAEATPEKGPQTPPWPQSSESENPLPSPKALDKDTQLRDHSLPRISLLVAALLGTLAVYAQWRLKRSWKLRSARKRPVTSEDLMALAATQTKHPGKMVDTIEKALIQRLGEKKLSATAGDSADRVQAFLLTLHKNLYGGNPAMTATQMLSSARALLRSL